ncbi:MAG: hypothetical protein AMXMBFR6_01420 [Betaproteobacteria bacterium]|nr:putative DNA-binding domain-containing protein [Rhodocyclaceae bacterium]
MTLATDLRQADFAAALLDPERPCPANLVAWNGSDPSARFAVYRNNVVFSLIEALADTFPVARRMVGTEFFRSMAAAFVRGHPPHSCVLAQYGEAFPDFVADFVTHFAPAGELPYLADLCRIEMARVRAYHAADLDPVAPDAVNAALACGEGIADITLSLHPSLSVVESDYAVASLWAADQTDADADAMSWDRPESALILRDGLDVLVRPVNLGSARFVQAVQQGLSFGSAAAVAAHGRPAFDLSATLTMLVRHSALTAIHPPFREPS